MPNFNISIKILVVQYDGLCLIVTHTVGASCFNCNKNTSMQGGFQRDSNTKNMSKIIIFDKNFHMQH